MRSKVVAVVVLLISLLYYPTYASVGLEEIIDSCNSAMSYINNIEMYRAVGAYENVLQETKIAYAGSDVDPLEFTNAYMTNEWFRGRVNGLHTDIILKFKASVAMALFIALVCKLLILGAFVGLWRIADKLYPNYQLD